MTEALTRPDPVRAMPRRPKKGDDDCATNFTGQPVERRLVWVSDMPLLVPPSVSRIMLIKTHRVCLTIGPLAVSKLFLICSCKSSDGRLVRVSDLPRLIGGHSGKTCGQHRFKMLHLFDGLARLWYLNYLIWSEMPQGHVRCLAPVMVWRMARPVRVSALPFLSAI